MAMRPRGSSNAGPRRAAPPRSGGVRPVYEDFKPMSEWQQNDESQTLNIYLPGFMKEQIKVSTEAHNTIRVRGERLVAGNKWSRFLEDFQVPENGEINSVRAKYQGGILQITIPKMEVAKPQEVLPPKPKTTDDIQKGQDKVSASSSQPRDEKSLDLQKTKLQGQDGDQKQPKGQDKVFPAVGTSQSSLGPQKLSGDHIKEHDQDVDGKKNENSGAKEKHITSEKPDNGTKEMVNRDEKKNYAGSKKLPEVETAKKMKLQKDGSTSIPEKKADNNEYYGAFSKEKYKKAVQGLAELNEERQVLVNMGVAMLVIVALTAYVTYKFASRKDKN